MNKFAVIDIGSNSVRLMTVADGKVLYKRVNTTRLGEGIANTPLLKADAIERSVVAVEAFFLQAKTEGAESVFAFATAAVRTAENGLSFVDAVKSRCGLDVEVVSGETEAELGITGALGTRDGGVIDVGGASTEIVLAKGGKIVYKKSLPIGVVRLKDGCGRDMDKLVPTTKEYATLFDVDLPKKIYAIGGTATTLMAVALGLQEYDSKKVTGSEISYSDICGMVEKFQKMTVEEIAKLPCMPKGRADVILGGAVLLRSVMEEKNLESLIVSDRDNLEGYAIQKGLLK